jgi:hypothetical protein
MRNFGVSVAILASVVVSACSASSSSPMSPAPGTPVANMAGSWSGTSADTTGQESLGWTLTQNSSAVTGTLSISDPGRGMIGNGSMQGTLSGSTLTFQMTVPNGGFSGMMAPCSMGMDGQATMSEDGHTMTGTYSGNMNGMMMSGMQSCGGVMNSGHFTMTR